MKRVNIAELAEAFSVPGIDPREHFSYGIVGRLSDDGYEIETDEGGDPMEFVTSPEPGSSGDVGPTAEVVLLPRIEQIEARIGTANAGTGTCALFPVHGGDTVLIGLPGGDPNMHPVILVRVNNEAKPFLRPWANDRVQIDVGPEPVSITNDAGSFIVWDESGGLTYRHPSGLFLQFDNDGYFKILDSAKTLLWSDASGIQAITAGGAAIKLGEDIKLLAPGNLDIGAKLVSVAGSMIVGGPGESVSFPMGLLEACTAAISGAIPEDGGKAAFLAFKAALLGS